MLVEENRPQRIVVQPETEAEQRLLYLLYDRLEAAFFTLDVADYPSLDQELASRREYRPDRGVDEPGSRAMVVLTGVEWRRATGTGGYAHR